MEEYSKTEKINLKPLSKLPKDYHCSCIFCKNPKFMGILIRPNGVYYNKHERKKYYVDIRKHVAKTPLHLTRYLIQNYSKPGDWVLDPTIGSGTTAVEALNHGRKVAGVDIQYKQLILDNIKHNQANKKDYIIESGDARDMPKFLKKWGIQFDLIINNPPYEADQCEGGMIWEVKQGIKTEKERVYLYGQMKKNLAFLKGNMYLDTVGKIYFDCLPSLKNGGYFCIGVKDMIKGGQPYLLHYQLGWTLYNFSQLKYVGMILLPHYPPTLFMSTYNKRFGGRFKHVKVPRYQTILIFKKVGKYGQ